MSENPAPYCSGKPSADCLKCLHDRSGSRIRHVRNRPPEAARPHLAPASPSGVEATQAMVDAAYIAWAQSTQPLAWDMLKEAIEAALAASPNVAPAQGGNDAGDGGEA